MKYSFVAAAILSAVFFVFAPLPANALTGPTTLSGTNGKSAQIVSSGHTDIAWIDKSTSDSKTLFYTDPITNTTITLDSNLPESIQNSVDIFGNTVYWVNGKKIKSYHIVNKEMGTLVDLSTLGNLEATWSITGLKVIDTDIIRYQLKKSWGGGSTSTPWKTYVISQKKSYGPVATDFSVLPGGGVSENGAAAHQPYFSQADEPDFEIKQVLFLNNQYIFYTVKNTKMSGATASCDAQFNSVNQYRLYDWKTGVTKIVKEGTLPDISGTDWYANSKTLVWQVKSFWKNTECYGSSSELNYNLLNPFTGTLTPVPNTTPLYAQFIIDTNNPYVMYPLKLEYTYETKNWIYFDATTEKTCEVKNLLLTPGIDVVLAEAAVRKETNGSLSFFNNICTPGSSTGASDPAAATQKDAGTLIRSSAHPAVYYKGPNNKRYVFPNQTVFYSWFSSFGSVQTISPDALAAIPIGGNVTFRPGSLVKIQTDPKVYAIDKNGTLRWVTSESVAKSIFGTSWAQQVRDIDDLLFVNYTIGAPITLVSDFNPTTAKNASPTISIDKGL